MFNKYGDEDETFMSHPRLNLNKKRKKERTTNEYHFFVCSLSHFLETRFTLEGRKIFIFKNFICLFLTNDMIRYYIPLCNGTI